MKNIHIIPTEKPSRLFKSFGKLNIGDYITKRENLQVTNQHIYITSDEEIKDGDWMIRGNEQPTLVTPNFFWDFGVRYYKIILTTDQDLIADGVQTIDDEFLEWFVNNPSCEEVEIKKRYSDFTVDPFVGYEIIILQEEPKQETLEETAERLFPKEKHPTSFETLRRAFISNAGRQQRRQETLEEAAEKMYTYDELRQIAYNAYCKGQLDNPTEGEFNLWIQQFKKK